MYYTHIDFREKITRRHMLPGYSVSCSFEGYTGADLILTPLKGIISQETIQNHMKAGAILIQIKHGQDFPSSVIDQRLFESLLRMTALGDYEPYQFGLLVTGDFVINAKKLYIEGRRANINADSYIGALNSWTIRGGAVYPNIKPEQIQWFVDKLGDKLYTGDPFRRKPQPRKRKKFREEKIYSKGMSLRQKAALTASKTSSHDLRHVLINLEGMSHVIVTGIWELMNKENEMNMAGFLSLLLSDKLLEVKGIGAKTNQKIKEQLGYE